MAMSIVHRVTGVALYFGTLLLAWWLIAAASGPAAYANVQAFTSSFIGRLIVFGYTWALLHHLLSGIRHFVWDLGYGFKASERESADLGRADRRHFADRAAVDRRLCDRRRTMSAPNSPAEIDAHAARPRPQSRLLAFRHLGFLAPARHRGRDGAVDGAGHRGGDDAARPQSGRRRADPRLAAGRDHHAAVHHRQRLAHEDRHAGGDRGLRACTRS